MEIAAIIKVRHPNTDLSPNSHSYSPSHYGFNSPELQISDIGMTTVQSIGYTSLKDLLPSSSSSPAVMSPTPSSSWYEIPIKNPLVKHAAMAYLQPMSSPPEIGNKGLLAKLKEKCFCGGGVCGCFGWINDVVLGTVREVFGSFWERRGAWSDEDEDEDEDDAN